MNKQTGQVGGDPHDLVAGYLLDALDGPERDRFVAHLPSCAACRAEVAHLEGTVADLAAAFEVVPPASLEAALVRALFDDEGAEADPGEVAPVAPPSLSRGSEFTAPRDPAPGRTHDARRRGRWLLPAAAAAAFVLGVGVATTTHQLGATDQQEAAAAAEMHQIMEITAAPDAHIMPMDVPGASTKLVISDDMDKGAVLATDLPMPAKAREYHLWSVMDDGSMRSAATFVPDQEGHVATVLATGVRDATAFMLTVEQPGAPHPTTQPIAEVST